MTATSPIRADELGRGDRAGRLLDDLLVAALDRAVALEEVDHVAVAIAEHLDLDVARLEDRLLDVDERVAEGALGLAPGALERVRRAPSSLVDEAHALAAAAEGRLDQHRVADARGRGARLVERRRARRPG